MCPSHSLIHFPPKFCHDSLLLQIFFSLPSQNFQLPSHFFRDFTPKFSLSFSLESFYLHLLAPPLLPPLPLPLSSTLFLPLTSSLPHLSHIVSPSPSHKILSPFLSSLPPSPTIPIFIPIPFSSPYPFLFLLGKFFI